MLTTNGRKTCVRTGTSMVAVSALTLLLAVTTTVVAFTPLLFIAGIMGQFISVMPTAVIAILVVSLVEALIILPAHLNHALIRTKLATARRISWHQRIRDDQRLMYEHFPRLSRVTNRLAGYCSGGEQQMIAIARALMAAPKMLMLDEPSLGLAPLLVKEIFANIQRINQEMGATILIVEQNAKMALEISDYAYIMESGKIVLEGPSDELKDNPDVKEFYMGVTQGGGRKSFKEVKSYKRRKRWM